MSLSRPALLLGLLVLPACITDFAISPKADDPELPLDTDVAVSLPDDTDVEAPVDTGEAPLDDPVIPDDPAPEDDCDHTSDLIYVLSRGDDTVYLFDPITAQLSLVGELDCNSWSDPGSMAVTRDGRLFVRYGDQTIHEVDLQTMACTQTPYSNATTNFGPFGMGYATTNAGSWRDHLFIANGHKVARLDTNTWQLTHLGAMPSQSELTGNADGELWAFFPLESPAALVHADQGTAAVQQIISLSNFPNPFDIDAFAFAQWGGDFFLFVRTYGVGNSSDVYKVSGSGSMTRIAQRIGIDIVGAGVSTCAPTQ